MAIEPGDGGPGHSWFAVEVTSEPVPEPVPWPEPEAPEPDVGGGRTFTYGGGGGGSFVGITPRKRVRITVPMRVETNRREIIAASLSGEVAAVRPISVRLAGNIQASRRVQFAFEGARAPAHRWNAIIREDDELLLALVS